MPEQLQTISALYELPRLLNELLKDTAKDLRKLRPRTGGFSLAEQICHLRDLEQQGYLVRIRRMLDEDRPDLVEFDGDKVARESDYHSQDPERALEAFVDARTKSISLLSELTREQFDRRGRFGTFGMITIDQLLGMMIEHDKSHARDLEELRKELQ